jgi:hypothetical protein
MCYYSSIIKYLPSPLLAVGVERDATEQLLKTLTPESTTYLNSRTLASLRTQKEEKDGEKLLQIGEAMQQADQYTVPPPAPPPPVCTHVSITHSISLRVFPVPLRTGGVQTRRDDEEGGHRALGAGNTRPLPLERNIN